VIPRGNAAPMPPERIVAFRPRTILTAAALIVGVAKPLGHTPETCLRYYARLFDEAPEHPVPAEEAIRAAPFCT
jgi:hypothetical protein